MGYMGTIHGPPYVRLIWGDFFFQGALTSASAKFTMFNKYGCPIRARIEASFEQVVTEKERVAGERKSSPSVHRVWRIRDADRIDRIAGESYGDSRYWYSLALGNRLANPRRLVSGGLLKLPRLE